MYYVCKDKYLLLYTIFNLKKQIYINKETAHFEYVFSNNHLK